MLIIGILLMMIGFGTGLAIFMGVLPESLRMIANLPVGIFWGIGIVGVILVVLNRRPRD